jgi:xanthine dehydrogenase accessory factor
MQANLKKQVKEQLKNARRLGFAEMTVSADEQRLGFAFLEHIKPKLRLIIAGGGHIGQALAHLASLLEFEVTVVDDRSEFANTSIFPDADHLVVKDIGSAMSEMEYGPDSYVVIVTRGHRQDGEALKACIGSGAAYIGMIGSSHKVGIMKKLFISEQWASREQWASLHTPIGLNIGSQTVQEIAMSIAAQLVEVRNRKGNENK